LGRHLHGLTEVPNLQGEVHGFREHFERHIPLLASLNHPNIAHIFGVAESNNGRALAMELVEGESPKGPLPFDEAWKIASQILVALEYAHERGIHAP